MTVAQSYPRRRGGLSGDRAEVEAGVVAEDGRHPGEPRADRIARRQEVARADGVGPKEGARRRIVRIGGLRPCEEGLVGEHVPDRLQRGPEPFERRRPVAGERFQRHAEPGFTAVAEIGLVRRIERLVDIEQNEKRRTKTMTKKKKKRKKSRQSSDTVSVGVNLKYTQAELDDLAQWQANGIANPMAKRVSANQQRLKMLEQTAYLQRHQAKLNSKDSFQSMMAKRKQGALRRAIKAKRRVQAHEASERAKIASVISDIGLDPNAFMSK